MMSTDGIVDSNAVKINNVKQELDAKLDDVKEMVCDENADLEKSVVKLIDELRRELKNDIRIVDNISKTQHVKAQQHIQELYAQTRFNCNIILAFIAILITHISLS